MREYPKQVGPQCLWPWCDNEAELFTGEAGYTAFSAYCHGHNIYIWEKFTYELTDELNEESHNGVYRVFRRPPAFQMILDDPIRRSYYRSGVMAYGKIETVETDKV